MEILLQIILSSVILPLILSVIAWWLIQRHQVTQWILSLVWIPSYIYLSGIPSIPPAEAKDWLWLLPVLSILTDLLFKSRLIITTLLQTLLLAIILIAIAWPVLQYQFNMLLITEIIIVLVSSYIIFYFPAKMCSATPTLALSALLSIAISCAGLALVVTLVGSLLIGQLAGILAVMLGVFVIVEFVFKSSVSDNNAINLSPFIQLYFTILVIARIYVEVPLEIAFLLLLAPLVGLLPKQRYSFLYSAITVVIAMSWLMFTSDSSSYY